MGAKRVSDIGKKVSEDEHMSMDVVAESQFFAEALQKAEYRGLGDTREAARYRVARKTGVPESYLKRLRYKAHEMTDVAGSVYRNLRQGYDDLCVRNEAAADAYRAERLKIEDRHEADQEHLAPLPRMVAPPSREETK